jgi:hypothetical protein
VGEMLKRPPSQPALERNLGPDETKKMQTPSGVSMAVVDNTRQPCWFNAEKFANGISQHSSKIFLDDQVRRHTRKAKGIFRHCLSGPDYRLPIFG